MPDDLDADTFGLINTELAERLKRQIDSGKSIDTKAGIVAGVPHVHGRRTARGIPLVHGDAVWK